MELSFAQPRRRWGPRFSPLQVAAGSWVVVAGVSLTVGASGISLNDVWQGLLQGFGQNPSAEMVSAKAAIFWQIRLPRLLLATCVGAGLGMAGAAIQGLLRNPLAEPGLLGVSSGAALFTILALVLGVEVGSWLGAFVLPLSAFIGSMVFTLLVFSLARWLGNVSSVFLILAGIGITALIESLIGFLVALYTDDAALRSFTFWRMGGLAGATWLSLTVALPLMLLPLAGLFRLARPLNTLSLGESEAQLMGVPVNGIRSRVIVFTALTIGAAVSLSGQIAFVGLAVPHVVRLWVGANQVRVLPLSAAVGAALLVTADTLARVVIAPAELPVGLFTAVVGAPTLLWILTRDFRQLRDA